MDDDFKSFYRGMLEKELEGTLPPALLARYEISSCLAHSPRSEIYLVTRREDGVLGILRVSKDKAQDNAQAEYEILERLHHPAIPRPMDVYTWEGKGYLVRQYMEGQTLARYAQTRGALPQEEVVRIGIALADILAVLHSQTPPVIHRDIKPENIIIDKDGGLRLIDFGIARVYRDKAPRDTYAIGTDYYMAPEQFGGAQTDGRSDIFSLGVVLVFLGAQSPEVKDLDRRYPYKALTPILKRCVLYDPGRRYQRVTDLRRALRQARDGSQRRLWMALGACLLAFAAGGLGLTAGYRWGQDDAFSRGLTQGMQTGFAQGYDQGSREGREAGFAEGMERTEAAVSAGEDPSAMRVFDQAAKARRGNTNPNFINRSLCAIDGQVIYYSAGGLILCTDDPTGPPTVLSTQPGENLNAYDGQLYFTNEEGVWRVPLAGGETTRVSDVMFGRMAVIDDVIYGTNALDLLYLYRMDLDGENLRLVYAQEQMYYLNIEGDWLVYADGIAGNHLTAHHLGRAETKVLVAADINWVNVVGDDVYYTKYGSDTGFYRIRLSGGEPERIGHASPAFTNVTAYGVCFADGYDVNHLYWMRLDGGEKTQLRDMKAADINVAGEWIFFLGVGEDKALYRMRMDGTGFGPAPLPGDGDATRGAEGAGEDGTGEPASGGAGMRVKESVRESGQEEDAADAAEADEAGSAGEAPVRLEL